jgi:hypothetical protein
LDGLNVGNEVGSLDGTKVGWFVPASSPAVVASSSEARINLQYSFLVGSKVGNFVGLEVGCNDGTCDGAGESAGTREGARVLFAVGISEGVSVLYAPRSVGAKDAKTIFVG